LLAACATEGSSRPPDLDAHPVPRVDAPVAVPDARVDAPTDWRARTLYLVMPDRYHNGDPANDDRGLADCFEPGEVRLFHGGDLAGLRARLPYLVDLGVGALWTTPLYRQSRCGYHGYWPDFVDPPTVELEPKLGTAGELDALLGELHAADIAYVLDMIVNHAGYGARLFEQRPGWFHDPSSCGDLGPSEQYCPLSNLPDLAQERDPVADYLDQQSAAWVDRFAVDAIRMDTAKHVPLAYFDRWRRAVDAARPGLVAIAEVFDGGAPSTYEPYLDGGFDSAFNFNLYYAMVAALGRGDSLDRLATAVQDAVSQLGEDRATWLTNMIANHDLPRFAAEMPGEMAAAERAARHRLALVTLFTVPGVPQLYAGDELGLTGSWPDNRRDMPSWAWQASSRAGDHPEALAGADQTYDLTARLTRIRGANPALWRGGYAELWRQNAGPPVFAFFRSSGDSRIAVVINAGPSPAALALPIATNPGIGDNDRAALADGTTLDDLLSSATARISGGDLQLELPAFSARILSPR
jgi:glycosidase